MAAALGSSVRMVSTAALTTASPSYPKIKSSSFHGASLSLPQSSSGFPTAERSCSIRSALGENSSFSPEWKGFGQKACGALAAISISLSLAISEPSFAANQARLPPLSNDPNRCERAFDGNTIGQANGVADKLLDLRKCNYADNVTDLKGKTLSAALMADAVFDGADMTEVVMSKAYAVGASFQNVNFTNSVLDRVIFDGSNLRGANFYNAVLSGSTFDNADLTGATFEDTLIGYVDIQKLCRNKTLEEFARLDLACK